MIELLYAAERMVELATDPEITSPDVRRVPTGEVNPDGGIGSVEAPRGTLTHHYEADERGVLRKVNLVVGTTNNHAAIAMSIRRAAERTIGGGRPIDDGLLNRVEMAFRLYDPCLSCATHSLPGQMPMIVTVRGPAGPSSKSCGGTGEDVRTVVIGVGNTTLRDDGVGVYAAREVAHGTERSGAVDVVDLGAGGLRLMEAMVGYGRAIVLDALCTGDLPAGTTVELEMGDLRGARNLSCTHDMSLPLALEWGRALGVPLPSEIRIFGVEAADVSTFGDTLTPGVAAAVPDLVGHVLALLTEADGQDREP